MQIRFNEHCFRKQMSLIVSLYQLNFRALCNIKTDGFSVLENN